MWRRAAGTPIDSATARRESDAELIGTPFQAELARRRHVADERRRRDDGGTRQEPFAPDSHPVLPVAIERRDGALTLLQRVGSLAEARPAPRLADFAADGAEHIGDR